MARAVMDLRCRRVKHQRWSLFTLTVLCVAASHARGAPATGTKPGLLPFNSNAMPTGCNGVFRSVRVKGGGVHWA
jgi:hypothetical protein